MKRNHVSRKSHKLLDLEFKNLTEKQSRNWKILYMSCVSSSIFRKQKNMPLSLWHAISMSEINRLIKY